METKGMIMYLIWVMTIKLITEFQMGFLRTLTCKKPRLHLDELHSSNATNAVKIVEKMLNNFENVEL